MTAAALRPSPRDPTRLAQLAALGSTVALLSGCMNLAGVGGSSRYGCKAPEGVACQSMSGVYANSVGVRALNVSAASRSPSSPEALAKSAPGRAGTVALSAPSATSSSAAESSPGAGDGQMLRSPVRILRLWVKPWEDADRDLYDEGYVYVRVDSGQWLIDHAQQRIRDAYAPVRPPRYAPPAPAGSPSAPEPAVQRPALDTLRGMATSSPKSEPQE